MKKIINVDEELDKNLIIKLRKCGSLIHSEMNETFYLYKKYIKKDAQMYCSDCSGGPSNSIQRYWNKVISLDINNLQILQ